jgi:hypothetical protein
VLPEQDLLHLVDEPAGSASHEGDRMHQCLFDYFRCPQDLVTLSPPERLQPDAGYFTFGDAVVYGRSDRCRVAPLPTDGLEDSRSAVAVTRDGVRLPFDLDEVVTNLRQERYRQPAGGYLEQATSVGTIQSLYYLLRPVLPVAVRRHLQRVRLSGWERIAFPRWPLDTGVDSLMRTTLGLLIGQNDGRAIPFVWFWPEGAPGCVVMTHDVEGAAGGEFCGQLMDLDDANGVKSAFQIVPEMPGQPTRALVDEMRRRGFEVNLHDLNHDGYLFHERAEFLERAAVINRYTRELGCRGFRSGAMYREQDWFDAFEFSYDMSVPNVAHLEPQRGGCCTVMPYFVGDLLELPLTTTQDYSLFHIIGEHSSALWKQQIELILAVNGLVSFIAHPDYLIEKRARAVYLDLLAHLKMLREARHVWMALPADVDRWWRNRRQMTLVERHGAWQIEGPDAERARLAYAALDGEQVVYRLAA